jgi:hypothetical protein
MATVNDNNRSNISSEALNLLDRFGSGLDELVYEIAEERARVRNSVAAHETISIDEVDVRWAADTVLKAITEKVAGEASSQLNMKIQSMYKGIESN